MESIDRSVEFKTKQIESNLNSFLNSIECVRNNCQMLRFSLRYSNIVTHTYAVPSLFSNRQWPACLPNGMCVGVGVVNIGESVRFDLVRPFERLSLLAQTFDWIQNCCAARNKNATHAERRLLGALKVASIALWCGGCCCFCFIENKPVLIFFQWLLLPLFRHEGTMMMMMRRKRKWRALGVRLSWLDSPPLGAVYARQERQSTNQTAAMRKVFVARWKV